MIAASLLQLLGSNKIHVMNALVLFDLYLFIYFLKFLQMGSLFGKPEKTGKQGHSINAKANGGQVTDKDRAVLDLKNARDKLKRYRKKVIYLIGDLMACLYVF